MATLLSFDKPGYEEQSKNADLLNKAMDMSIERYSTVPLEGEKLVRKETNVTGGVYKEFTVGNVLGLPVEAEDTDALPVDTSAPGYDITATMVEYRLGLFVPKSMFEDAVHQKMNYIVSGLPDAAARRIELAIKYYVTNMFATAAGADGMYWCDTDHPNENPETGTWDNLTTGPLSHATFSAARTMQAKLTDERGFVMPVTPNALWVGPDTQEAGEIIRQSEKVSGGSLNDPNVINNGWTVEVYHRMPTTTQWFVTGQPKGAGQIKKGLVYAEQVAPQILPVLNVDTSVIPFAKQLRMRYGMALGTDKTIVGSVGT